MKALRLTYMIAAALLAASVGGCSSSSEADGPAAGTSRVAVSLTAATRSDAAEALPADELMQSWWVVFVNARNEVQRIVGSGDALSGAVEEDHFSLELPNATYRVYAFANITPAQLLQAAGLSFAEGEVAPALSSAQWGTDLNEWSGPLPMTGYIPALQVAKDAVCEVEMVRLVAKLQVDIIDGTSERTTAVVNSVAISPITVGPCDLLPDYSTLGGYYEPATADGLASREVTLDLSGGKTSAVVYLRESSAADAMPAHNPSGRFQLRVSVSRNGADATDFFALTDELLSLCRNDYVTIPLMLTDYTLAVDVNFYPPIGGYPAVVVEPQGDDYTITFGSTGYFSITALVYDAAQADGSQPIVPENVALTVADPDGIFAEAPAIDPVTGEIVGELGSNAGTALVRLAVTVRQSPTVDYTFSRTLHILRQ